jgi:acetylornithine deacetylase
MGVNAIHKGYNILKAVEELEKRRIARLSHPLYPDTREALPCMVCIFQSGSFPSAFPETCLLRGSVATLPNENAHEVKRQFEEHIFEASSRDSWLRDHPPEVGFKGYFAEPSEIPVEHPIVKTISKEFREVTGRNPVISGRMGAADTRFLNTYGGTPSVIFGPGDTGQMHAVNEWVCIEDHITATKVLTLTILDWCGYKT